MGNNKMKLIYFVHIMTKYGDSSLYNFKEVANRSWIENIQALTGLTLEAEVRLKNLKDKMEKSDP